MVFFNLLDIWFYLGLIMVGVAIIILLVSFIRYARKKLSDGFMMIWLIMSITIVILGITLIVTGYSHALLVGLVTTVCGLLLIVIFITSSMVSELMMKVRELAMQVALLNQENDSLLQQINHLKEQDKDA